MPFSACKRYVYRSERCLFQCFVNILYLFSTVFSLRFSISSENPDIIRVSLCEVPAGFTYNLSGSLSANFFIFTTNGTNVPDAARFFLFFSQRMERMYRMLRVSFFFFHNECTECTGCCALRFFSTTNVPNVPNAARCVEICVTCKKIFSYKAQHSFHSVHSLWKKRKQGAAFVPFVPFVVEKNTIRCRKKYHSL